MSMLTRAYDLITGRADSGRAVDAAFPDAPLGKRMQMVRSYAGQSGYRQSFKRFTNAGGLGNRYGVGQAGPKMLAQDIATLRAEGRRVSMTNPHAVQAIRILSDWTIGSGFNMTWRASNKAVQKRLDKAVGDWFMTSGCDANRHANFYAITHLAYKTVKTAGECLVRIRPRKTEDGLAVPMAIEVLSPDYFYDGFKPLIKAGNSYASGIEFSPIGHPEAYWLFRGHPDDSLSDRTPVRVPILDDFGNRQIVHLFDREFPGQIRGIPRASIIVNTIYEQNDLRMSLLSRKRAEAKNVYWLKNKGEDDAPPPLMGPLAPGTSVGEDGTVFDSLTGEVVASPELRGSSSPDPDALSDWIQEQLVGEGNVVVMPPDFDIESTDLSASTDYSPFMEDLLNTVATGFGVPSSLMTANLKGVPFSGSKVGFLQFKAEREREQEYWVSELCKFVWAGFANAGERAGLWRATDVSCDFLANAFPSVEPTKDQTVYKGQLETFAKSHIDIAAEQGGDFERSIAGWIDAQVIIGFTNEEARENLKKIFMERAMPKSAVALLAPLDPNANPDAEPPEPSEPA